MEEHHGDEDEGAGVLMMPPMPLVRPMREDKASGLDRFVRAEYGETCAGWITCGSELETGTSLPCAHSSARETHGRSHGPERGASGNRCCVGVDQVPSQP